MTSNSKTSRQLNLAKHLPSALRKKTRTDSTGSTANKDTGSADSPLIHDNPIEDVMAKYQTLTKKEDPSVGQLISLEINQGNIHSHTITSFKLIFITESKPEPKKSDDNAARIEDVRRKLRSDNCEPNLIDIMYV